MSHPLVSSPVRGAVLGMISGAFLGVASLGQAGCGESAECTVPDQVDPDWIRTLGCERDYEVLWSERNDAIFARTRTINWLIDREDGQEDGGRVYFIDTVDFSLHYFFAATYLDYPDTTPVGSHEEFNLLNYRRPGRRFILGKLLRYVDQDLLTMEFSAGDNADAEMIVFAYERLADSIYNGAELRYRPVSAYQESLLPELDERIPVIRTEEVFHGQSYQPLHQAIGYGTLRFARVAELAAVPLLPSDIAVLDRVPNDITMVSGIITEEFQTPLSHINILSRNRGTPNMGLRDAFTDPALRALEGELVRLEVNAHEYLVEPAELADAQAFWAALRPSEPLVPQYDSSHTRLLDVSEFGHEDAIAVGAKAANVGEMARIDTGETTIPLPDQPFAIPFWFYERHLATDPELGAAIDALLAEVATLAPEELQMRLFAIRWAIYTAPMDPAHLALIVDELRARSLSGTRMRFRSSTNVEDLPEFSGAGLYTSASAELAEGEAAIENAVKVVWASTWNYQAFVEREFYRVTHGEVRMAVLVHPAFENELANGVAITINEFTPLRPAYFINSQLGEVSVTNPTGQAIPEQILYYTWYEEPEYEVITRSSLLAGNSPAGPGQDWPAGQAVFTDPELAELARYLEAIHNHFRGLYQGGQNFAMDVEFKLAPGRQLVIKQARPLARHGP